MYMRVQPCVPTIYSTPGVGSLTRRGGRGCRRYARAPGTGLPAPGARRLVSAALLGGLGGLAAGLAVAAPGRGGLGGRLTAAGGLARAAPGTPGRAGAAVGGRRRVGQGRGALGLLETDDLRATAERGRRGTVARTRGGVPGGGGERRTRGAVGRHRPGPHTSTAGLGARRLRRRRASRGGGVRGRRRGTGGRGGAVAGRPVPRRGAEAGAGRGLRGGVGGHPALPGGLARLLGLHLEVEQVAHRLLLDGLV